MSSGGRIPALGTSLTALLVCGCASLRAILPSIDGSAETPYEFIEAISPTASELGFGNKKAVLPSTGSVKALVVFAQFRGESKSDDVPRYAARMFDPAVEGSFAHFYDIMSFGQLQVSGKVLPRRYTSLSGRRTYTSKDPAKKGRFPEFVQEILDQVDAETDFGQFDNDDDGLVDHVFILVRSTPTNFILGGATGIAGLGFERHYLTKDKKPDGRQIRISGDLAHGSILKEGPFAQTVGVMAHEFGHSLGLRDLYDQDYSGPVDDSAGIGRWGLMGRGGVMGWEKDRKADGPNPLSARSLELLGWIGPDNERLVEISDDADDLEIADLYEGGHVLRIPLKTEEMPSFYPDTTYREEYLLLEHRSRAGFYNRNLPAEGLLMWHVRAGVANNNNEHRKAVDLICADGLFGDAGYPQGIDDSSISGSDNLDYWAHDRTYTANRKGNDGDRTDPFDGDRYTRFDRGSNPSSDIAGNPSSAQTGLDIRMARQSASTLVNVRVPRWAGTIDTSVHWQGDVIVDGDLTISPEGSLVIYGPTTVRIAPDRTRSGFDSTRTEIRVEGTLTVHDGARKKESSNFCTFEEQPGPVVFEAARAGDTWLGILPAERAELVGVEDLELRDSEYGMLEPGVEPGLPGAGVPTVIRDDEVPAAIAEADSFALLTNYPNPFESETTLRYTLGKPAEVRLTIYNSVGQRVRTLVDELQSQGLREQVWAADSDDGRRVANGVYLYKLDVPGEFADRGKMLLLNPGFAQLQVLEEALEGRTGPWSDVRADLDHRPAYGYAPKDGGHAAFGLGMGWVSLRASMHRARNALVVRRQLQVLRRQLLLLEPTGRQLQGFDSLARSMAATAPVDVLLQFDDLLRGVIRADDSRHTAHYELGKWIQGLRAAAIVSREYELAVAELSDLSGHVATGRQFARYLRETEGGDTIAAAIDELVAAIEAAPAADGGVAQLLLRLDAVRKSLAERDLHPPK